MSCTLRLLGAVITPCSYLYGYLLQAGGGGGSASVLFEPVLQLALEVLRGVAALEVDAERLERRLELRPRRLRRNRASSPATLSTRDPVHWLSSTRRLAGVDRRPRARRRGRNKRRRRRRPRWREGWCRGSPPRPWRSALASAASPASFFSISYFGGFLHRGGVSRLVASRGRRVSDRYRREICNYVRRSVAPSQSPLKFTKTLCPKKQSKSG